MNNEIRKKVCELTSEMLDNPDDCGIYLAVYGMSVKLERMINKKESSCR